MNEWLFNGKPFRIEQAKGYEGFVYVITNLTTGKQYIGRKYFSSLRKKKGKERRSRFSSDWSSYWGSCISLLEDIKELGHKHFRREIISLHKTRGDTNYYEVKEQFSRNVLEGDGYYNDNIAARWHRKPKHIIEARQYGELL